MKSQKQVDHGVALRCGLESATVVAVARTTERQRALLRAARRYGIPVILDHELVGELVDASGGWRSNDARTRASLRIQGHLSRLTHE